MTRRDLLAHTARNLALWPAFSHEGKLTMLIDPLEQQPEASLPTYRCPKVEAFRPDGNLLKNVWRHAPAVRLVSATGKPQRLQPTRLRACWSEARLYVAFDCADRELHCTYTHRDDPLYDEDVVEVFLGLSSDLRHYIELEFNAKETIFDALITNSDKTGKRIVGDKGWNCNGLECRAKLHTRTQGGSEALMAWSVEAAIPFAGLGVSAPSVGDRWRANFYRIEYSAPTEYSAWSPTLAVPANYHVPDRFGWLEFSGKA